MNKVAKKLQQSIAMIFNLRSCIHPACCNLKWVIEVSFLLTSCAFIWW